MDVVGYIGANKVLKDTRQVVTCGGGHRDETGQGASQKESPGCARNET